MSNLRPFQIVLLGIFGLFAIIGLAYFGLYKGGANEQEPYAVGVIIWGTLDGGTVNNVLAEVGTGNSDFQKVRYQQKDSQTFNLELLNAIAENRAPDLIILPSTEIVTHRSKLFSLPYESIPERTYRDTYIDGTDIYLMVDGVYGIPFAVDPLMMYWNRDLVASGGLANPPKTWEELVSVSVPALTRKSSDLTITQSAVAFGEYANIRNAKNILSMLLLQSGTSIAEEQNGAYVLTLKDAGRGVLPPADAALSFYTQFALPTSALYSWNKALTSDRSAFTAGTLAFYFGLGSEIGSIQRANPNLNFDVTQVPQGVGTTVQRNYGIFYAFAIPRASGNPSGALAVAQILSSIDAGTRLATALNMAPVRRSVLAGGSQNVYQQSLFISALISRAWLDPNSSGSEQAFKTMIEDVTSGRERVGDAVEDAIGRLQLLF